MKKIVLILLSITFLIFGCAKPTSVEKSPNSFYYYAYAKYSITISDYINWGGLFFYPSEGKFSLNYQSPDFTCIGLASYQSTTGTSNFFPTNDGETLSHSGNLLEPVGGCFNSITSFSVKKIGSHLGIPFYELTLGAERYLIRTNQ